ncbi:creatininase family protein [Komagataeibacter oboediens]|uniref:Creatininase family protein n=1 Tax=Komagataeibacter oboediens TaxID=65958 RepID=A0ABS5SPA4_9PROT|nr:creatininase family protein [Komagataeibacter oboediens]MBL7234108.1 creatininase family protein [Komagataeibacter oboediens]MBT0675996.1 creatininase family protein [Komagataeibacter oboediens]MBT0679162.1 creatininase family protein [Komagataeibacter oboediens]
MLPPSSDDILYEVRGPKSWECMTSAELAGQLAMTDCAIVPVGAVEQHAGHLPLGQDNFQISEIVRRSVLQLAHENRHVIFGPTIPFGPVSNVRFAGCINIRPSTLAVLTKEVCLNLHRDGVNTIVLAMGHDLSLGALMVAARELTEETGDRLRVIVANWLPYVVSLLPQVFTDLPPGARDGHGGAGETARMLAQHPALVRMDLARDYHVAATRSATPFAHPVTAGGGVYIPRATTIRDEAFQGILGCPSLGTPEIGETLYDALSSWLSDIVREYCFGASESYNY